MLSSEADTCPELSRAGNLLVAAGHILRLILTFQVEDLRLVRRRKAENEALHDLRSWQPINSSEAPNQFLLDICKVHKPIAHTKLDLCSSRDMKSDQI